MYRLPLLMTLILSLMLPAFGAMAAVTPEPCPMQAAMADHEQAAVDAPCCEEMADASSSNGQMSCKSGQECKTGGLLQTAVIRFFVPLSPRPQTALVQSLTQREPAGLWRPPRVC